MGKGDKKSKKGKRWRKSYGNSRNKNAIKARVARANTGGGAAAAESKAAKPKAKKARKKAEAE